jgi:hypothetical protein
MGKVAEWSIEIEEAWMALTRFLMFLSQSGKIPKLFAALERKTMRRLKSIGLYLETAEELARILWQEAERSAVQKRERLAE